MFGEPPRGRCIELSPKGGDATFVDAVGSNPKKFHYHAPVTLPTTGEAASPAHMGGSEPTFRSVRTCRICL